jgi:uncharacterized protein (TIGR03083 family)
MFDLESTRRAVQRDGAALTELLEATPSGGWDKPMNCAGWTVRDLGRHLVAASRGQADGLRRTGPEPDRLATLDLPDLDDPDAIVQAFDTGLSSLQSALEALTPEQLGGLTPLPFGVLPTGVALQIVGLEYGFHRYDLATALGEPEHLGDDMSSTLLEISPGLLPMLAGGTPVGPPGEKPAEPTAYHLATPGPGVSAVYDEEWAIAPGDPAPGACRISGDAEALALFVMGRIDASDSRLMTTSPGAAALFKSYFPGP